MMKKSRIIPLSVLLVVAGFGCTEADPSSGMDVPVGCGCGEPLEELDRRLRTLESASPAYGGTFTMSVPRAVTEGSSMKAGVIYRNGDWWLAWEVIFVVEGEDSSRCLGYAIPYPTGTGSTPFATMVLGVREFAGALTLRDPATILEYSAERVKVEFFGMIFNVDIPPIPEPALVFP